MANIVIYSKANCAYCTFAKEFLTSKNLPFTEIRIDLDAEKQKEMVSLSGKRTTPQIFINDQPIGGYDDLAALAQSGQLTALLNKHSS